MNSPIFTLDAAAELDRVLSSLAPSGRIVVITDSTVERVALPQLLEGSKMLGDAAVITIAAGEVNKNLASLAAVWEQMSLGSGATRRSAAVCVGGGVVTDLGGFAAATFKRGIPCINIPTTLLAQVDASVGGKTGIDFMGLKNEIGAFAVPEAVIVSPQWLATLSDADWLSGYGEMVKHALLAGQPLAPLAELRAMAPAGQLVEIRRSVAVKERIVEEDPREKGLRAALNLGHTAGHAVESLLIEQGRGISHGSAVAFGLMTALVLSRMLRAMPSETLYTAASLIRDAYGPWPLTCDDYPRLLELMRHDKKNLTGSTIRFVLLDRPGQPALGIEVADSDIRAAFDITRDLLGS